MMPLLAAASSVAPDYWPFIVLLISVAVVIVLITVARVHAFFALVLAAFAAGLLSRPGTLPGEPAKSHWLQAIEVTAAELGSTAGRIGVVIALAAVIGMCLMESGAADKVVRRFLAAFGEKRAGAAILISGYILSIPIFFDTFFMLLLPLARAMAIRTGKDYLLYVMAICCGGTVTHSLIAPHPGPLAMAESLKLDLGLTIMVGIVVGIIPTLASWGAVKWLNKRFEFPLRETAGTTLQELKGVMAKPESELPSFGVAILPVILPIALISLASTFIAIQGKGFELRDLTAPAVVVAKVRDDPSPPFAYLRSRWTPSTDAKTLLAEYKTGDVPSAALQNAVVGELNKIIRAPIPIVGDHFNGIPLRPEAIALTNSPQSSANLVRLNRMLLEDAMPQELRRTSGMNPSLFTWGEFVGNRNVALLIGALLAIAVLMRQRGWSLAKIGETIGPPFETAGVIILITSAGGAFGLMLQNAGVGKTIEALVAGKEINLILLSWFVAAVIRVAQGSATVAMLTTAAMIYPIMSSSALPYHPIYIFMSIGFGAMMLSWMNDSGFWVVGRLSGFTEKETLKSWTVVVTVNSLAGLLACIVLSKLIPLN